MIILTRMILIFQYMIYRRKKDFQKFYSLFETIDSIHKTIDNMVYLEKYLKRQAVIVPEQPPKKVIVESSDEEEQVGPQNLGGGRKMKKRRTKSDRRRTWKWKAWRLKEGRRA